MCTFGWASPESLRDDDISTPSDVWSWACIVWEMVNREVRKRCGVHVLFFPQKNHFFSFNFSHFPHFWLFFVQFKRFSLIFNSFPFFCAVLVQFFALFSMQFERCSYNFFRFFTFFLDKDNEFCIVDTVEDVLSQ